MIELGPPRRQGLYDPWYEHDACGVGFVVDLKNLPCKHGTIVITDTFYIYDYGQRYLRTIVVSILLLHVFEDL